nr:uncharacterized protein LOC117837393 [Setaria viridis]
MELVPESFTPDELAPKSQEPKEVITPDSEMVPDSLPPSAFICSRCGLVHVEYRLGAMIYTGLDEFDCNLFIPDLDNVVMDGDTIVLPAHELKMLDEKRECELAAGKDDARAPQE